jgi:hypothetical protein
MRIAGHWHIPPLIIEAIRCRLPGLLLVRPPHEAVVSWAIYHHRSVEDCLDYYIDFHRTLLPYCKDVYVVTFDDLTADPAAVLERFARTQNLAAKPHASPSLVASTLAAMDAMPHSLGDEGEPNELRVSRPSAFRSARKDRLREALDHCASLTPKLWRAEKLYETFAEVKKVDD